VKTEQEKTGKNPYQGKGESRDELNPRELINYFGNCEVFETKEDAFNEAYRLYHEIGFVEYGISFVSGWENKEFPKFYKENIKTRGG